MKAITTSTAITFAITLGLAAGAGCLEEEVEPCPEGVELDGSETCLCGDEIVDALPGDGSTCICDPVEGLVCEPMLLDCEQGVAFDGSELPCYCDGALVDALPGDGSECWCDATEGFICEPPSTTDCELDTLFDGSELPCYCGDELIDALPGDGSECWCDSTEGFVCGPLES